MFCKQFSFWSLKIFLHSQIFLVCSAQTFIPKIGRERKKGSVITPAKTQRVGSSGLRPQFDLAWSAVNELSQAETLEDIDIHAIPYGKDILCKACRLSFEFLISSHNLFVPDQVISLGLVGLCSLLQTQPVCKGVIELNMPIFLEILNRKPDLRAEQICGTVFEQFCTTDPVVEWSIIIPDNQTNTGAIGKKVSNKKETNLQNKKEEDIFEIAHVTDTHVDMKYAVGAEATGCREPLCCRENQPKPSKQTNVAGPWGNYKNCDIPWNTASNMLETLAGRHKNIKYLYMTGDLIAHNIWETTRENNIRQIKEQAIAFKDTLGTDVIILPVLGNHEPHPSNVLAPPWIEKNEFSGKWLYEAFYDAWCQHFPEESKPTFIKGGYYTLSPTPGFRIVGLNSLFGYVYNWWMIIDPVDPAGQLSWLRGTLMLAESNGEKVHILMHGPPAETDTLQVWRREYNLLITRFQSTVVGQFVGHTHRDQFYLSYSPKTKKPVAVAWNGGSVTTFTNVNPNYRIYFVNKNTLEVEDFDNYVHNLTESNKSLTSKPNWFKLYSFKDAYNVQSLSLKNIGLLVKRLAKDDNLFNHYYLNYMKNSDVAFKKVCDKKCRKSLLCKVVSEPHNSTTCESIINNVDLI